MKWKELLKYAKAQGFVFQRNGGSHDLYRNPETGIQIWIERHWSQEIRKGLQADLLKKINKK